MILYTLPISMISVALATVIFPKFSTNILKKEIGILNKNVNDAVRANLFIFVPVSFFFFVYGNDIIRLLFERGKFTSLDSQIAYNVLKYYTISLVFYATYSIYNKILYSARLVNGLLFITVSGIIIKIVLNILLVDKYQQDGLAFATTVSYIYFFLFSITLVYYKVPGIKHSIFFKDLLFYFLNGLICYFVVQILFENILRIHFYENIFKIIFFYALFIINLKIVDHGSIQLTGNILRGLKTVRSI